MSHEPEARGYEVVVFNMGNLKVIGKGSPPPRLHYLTFWKSVTRRVLAGT
jgi:hypothetical protein